VELVSIVVYPVKSCRGIALSAARIEKRGIAMDRRWMIVDAAGRFVTQREEPRLALIDVAVEGGALRLSSANAGEVELPITTEDGPQLEVEIWSRRVRAVVHEPGGRWLSAYVGRPLQLVHLPASAASPSSSRLTQPGDEVSFADGYPLHVATEESLADLGARMEARGSARVPMVRFRPNVVVRGATAWDEDGWARIAIGEVALRAPKGCDRCVMTTIDPATARLGAEPLRTLASFRKRDNAVWFGVNLTPDAEGAIAVGDSVRVIARVSAPHFDVPAGAA
jgi:uncharacterized protein YcbX